MLAGLLFAVVDTTDLPSRLVATLPFATGLVIEHQARQLIEAGATQIVVVADRADPALAGALHRIAQRGIAVDLVEGAAAAAAALHPLASLIVLADGLVAADGTIAPLARAEGEALLVVAAAEAPAAFERIGGAQAWAGVARLDPRRLDDVATLPADYDLQSALLRVAEAAGVERRLLPAAALDQGHGIERDGDQLAGRARRLAAASVKTQHGWYDRYLATPLARAVLPMLVTRAVPLGTVALAGGGLALVAALALGVGLVRLGLLLAIAATLTTAVGRALAALRFAPRPRRGFDVARLAVPSATLLLLAAIIGLADHSLTPLVVALALVVAALIAERAAREPRVWWGSPPAYLLVVSAAALVGRSTTGMAIAAAYAVATLAAAVEGLRHKA